MADAGTGSQPLMSMSAAALPRPATVLAGNRGVLRWVMALVLPFFAGVSVLFAALIWQVPLDDAHWLLAFLVFFIQHPGRWSHRADLGGQIITPWLVTAALLLVIGLVTNNIHRFSSREVYTWFLLTPVLQAAVLYLLPRALGALIRLWRREHRVLVIGANATGLGFGRALEKDPLAHSRVIGYFDDRRQPRDGGAVQGGIESAGRLADVARAASEERIDQIYVALPLVPNSRVAALVESLRNSTASVYLLPDISAVELIQPRVDTHAGYPIVGLCESPLQGVMGVVKRAFDIAFSLAALLAVMPLLIAIALAVRLSSSGPALFKQRRFGLDGSEIVVWKFRTMTVQEDGASAHTQVVRNDPRVTPLGAFLRRTSLDELPQLFNVLQGTMSLVGPRPHAIRVNENYRHLIDGYMIRHKVRPGLTGWAQVNGARGGDDLPSMERRTAYDLEYLRNWSFAFDLKIILLSFRALLRDPAAF